MAETDWSELKDQFKTAATHSGGVVCFTAGFAISAGALHVLLLALGALWSEMPGTFRNYVDLGKQILAYAELFLILLTFLLISALFVIQLVKMALKIVRE